jgi:hypothetical protein
VSAPGIPTAAPPRAVADLDLRGADEPSLGELVSRTTGHLSQLFRDEVELAKLEIKDEVTTAGRAGALLGAAGLLAYLALALLCAAAAWGLATVIPTGVAFLIIGALVALAAGVTYLVGRRALAAFDPVPTQTVETIQEDVRWARQLRS